MANHHPVWDQLQSKTIRHVRRFCTSCSALTENTNSTDMRGGKERSNGVNVARRAAVGDNLVYGVCFCATKIL